LTIKEKRQKIKEELRVDFLAHFDGRRKFKK